jgi:hypothetical protein
MNSHESGSNVGSNNGGVSRSRRIVTGVIGDITHDDTGRTIFDLYPMIDGNQPFTVYAEQTVNRAQPVRGFTPMPFLERSEIVQVYGFHENNSGRDLRAYRVRRLRSFY